MRWGSRPRSEGSKAELEQIRVYTAELIVDGWVAPKGDRMTDILQRAQEFAVLPAGADADDPDAWVQMSTAEAYVVVPPPHVSPTEWRQPREAHPVRLRIGDYLLDGTAHLRPGVGRDAYARATRPFLPLTGATLSRADGSEPATFDVVIVNLRWAEFLDS